MHAFVEDLRHWVVAVCDSPRIRNQIQLGVRGVAWNRNPNFRFLSMSSLGQPRCVCEWKFIIAAPRLLSWARPSDSGQLSAIDLYISLSDFGHFYLIIFSVWAKSSFLWFDFWWVNIFVPFHHRKLAGRGPQRKISTVQMTNLHSKLIKFVAKGNWHKVVSFYFCLDCAMWTAITWRPKAVLLLKIGLKSLNQVWLIFNNE